MRFRLFGCGKYRGLNNERFDRDLSLAEREFMAKHRSVCSECRMLETQSATALNMLRMAAFQDETEFSFEPQFEERIIRRLRVQTTRESVRYWSPAFFGAAIAGLIVMAALQMVSNRPAMPSSSHPDGTVYRTHGENLPPFNVDVIEQMR